VADVLLEHKPDGGDIRMPAGEGITMTEGLETAVYLSHFGGNAEDNGTDATAHLQWWGNRGETDERRQLRGGLQAALQSLPVTSGNLLRLGDIAADDLQWLVDEGLAESVRSSVTLVGPKRIELVDHITVSGRTYQIRNFATWGSAS
jgi:phage gp46-like protein